MNNFPLEEVKPDLFKRWLVFNQETWQDPNCRINQIAMAGNDEIAQAFFKPVQIGEFSRMVDLPVSTVRLYVRRGLIEPLVVTGKYRFMEWNVAQAEAVKLWSDLGITLEAMFKRKLELRKTTPGIRFFDVLEFKSGTGTGYGIGFFSLTPQENGGFQYSLSCSTQFNGEKPVGGLPEHPKSNFDTQAKDQTCLVRNELQAMFVEARLALEAEQQKLEARISRAKLFEERLAQPFFD